MSVMVQQPWQSIVADAPVLLGANSMTYSPWVRIPSITIPEGVWMVEWHVTGARQELLHYDLAILEQTNPPLNTDGIQTGDNHLQIHYYAGERHGRTLVYGPAVVYCRQNPLNAYLVGNTARQIFVQYHAIPLNERQLTHPGLLTTERVIASIPSLATATPVDLFPFPVTNTRWTPNRFQIVSACWAAGALVTDTMILRRYSIQPGGGSYTYPVFSTSFGSSFDYTNTQWVPNMDPRWGYVVTASTVNLLQFVCMWERTP